MAKKVFGQTAKWAASIEAQIGDVNKEDINTQYINLDQIMFDPENSRSLALSIDDVRNGPKLPKGDYDAVTQDAFKEYVEEYFESSNNKSVKIDEYLSLANLAASIKTPENLINPVTGYMDGMKFRLIAGHRRTLAHYILDCPHISAKLLSNQPSPLGLSLIQWSENEDRENLSVRDQIKAVSRIINAWETENQKPISVSKLTTLISSKKTKSAWFLKLCKNTDAEISELIENDVLSSLELGYKIASIKNKDERASAIKDIRNGRIKNAKDIKASNVRPPNTDKKRTDTFSLKQEDVPLLALAVEIANKNGVHSHLKNKKEREQWRVISSRFSVSEEVIDD